MDDMTSPTAVGVVDAQVAAGMTGLDFMRKLAAREFPAPPFSQTADIWPVEVEDGRVVFVGRPAQRFYNPMGTIHGGWLSSLLDSAMGCAVHTRLPAGKAYTTIELKVSFVKPAFEHSGNLRCEATLIHFGGRIATSEGRILDGNGTLIAHGSETCLLFDAVSRR